VSAMTVYRLEDGSTALGPALADELTMPQSWQARHSMLIDALEQVRREAGVVHTGSDDDPPASRGNDQNEEDEEP